MIAIITPLSSHLKTKADHSFHQQPDGTYLLRMPLDGDALVPMVHARHDTGEFFLSPSLRSLN